MENILPQRLKGITEKRTSHLLHAMNHDKEMKMQDDHTGRTA